MARAEGAGRSGVHRDAAARHVDRRAAASPARSGRRTRCCSTEVDEEFRANFTKEYGHPEAELPERFDVAAPNADGAKHDLGHGDVVIAAITSCTNTSNPSVLVAAGLVARKARALGLDSKPWVKTASRRARRWSPTISTAPAFSEDLNAIGFDLVGYGCTTCIGNSGPLPEAISAAIHSNDLVAASVLSGNRNFEGRVSPDVRANYLASPPLVVAYAIKGTVIEDMVDDPDRPGPATATTSISRTSGPRTTRSAR